MSTQDLLLFRKSSMILMAAFKDVYEMCGKQLERRAKKKGKRFDDRSDSDLGSSQDDDEELNNIANDRINGKNPKKNKYQQMAKKANRKQRVLQKPANPQTPYQIYIDKNKNQIGKKNPDLHPSDILKIMEEVWKHMQDDEKDYYIEAAEEMKIQYDRKMRLWMDQKQKALEQTVAQNSKNEQKKQKKDSKSKQAPKIRKQIQKDDDPQQEDEKINPQQQQLLNKYMQEALGTISQQNQPKPISVSQSLVVSGTNKTNENEQQDDEQDLRL